MKFLIRDDDPCFFTKVEELENCYGEIYDEVPICLSLTPFRVAGKYFPGAEDPDREMPIHENPDLVSYLNERLKKAQYEFAIHGYSHIYYNDVSKKKRIPEYVKPTDLYAKTAKAKSYLEDLFDCNINTFVPPSNRISKSGIDAVIKNGLNLMAVPGFSSGKRPFNLSNIPNFLKTRLWLRTHQHPIYPFPIDFGDHLEMASHLLYPKSELNTLLGQLESVSRLDGVFVLATHYHAFNKRIKSGETIGYALNKIIEKAKNMNGVRFITYKELWNRTK